MIAACERRTLYDDDACVYIFRCEFVLVCVNVEMRGMHEKCRATPHTERFSCVAFAWIVFVIATLQHMGMPMVCD